MNNKQETSRYGHATYRPKHVHSSLLVALADPRLLGLDQLLLTSIYIPSPPHLSSFFPLFLFAFPPGNVWLWRSGGLSPLESRSKAPGQGLRGRGRSPPGADEIFALW